MTKTVINELQAILPINVLQDKIPTVRSHFPGSKKELRPTTGID